MKPVNTGTVDYGWELTGTHSQRGTNRRETENNLYTYVYKHIAIVRYQIMYNVYNILSLEQTRGKPLSVYLHAYNIILSNT